MEIKQKWMQGGRRHLLLMIRWDMERWIKTLEGNGQWKTKMGPFNFNFNFNFTFVRKKEKLMSKLTNYCIVTFPVASYCVHQSATVGALPRLFSDTLLPTLPDSLSCCRGFSLSLLGFERNLKWRKKHRGGSSHRGSVMGVCCMSFG